MTVETNGASFPSLRIMSRSSSSSTRRGSVTVMLFCMRSRGELNLFVCSGISLNLKVWGIPELTGRLVLDHCWPPGLGYAGPEAIPRSAAPPRRRAGVRHGVRWVDNPYDDTPGSQREGAAPRASRLLLE